MINLFNIMSDEQNFLYDNYLETLNNMNKYIEEIIKQLNELVNKIPSYIETSKKLKEELQKCLNNFLINVNSKKEIKLEEQKHLFVNLKERLKPFYDSNYQIYENKHIKILKEKNEELSKIIDFTPPIINSFIPNPTEVISNPNCGNSIQNNNLSYLYNISNSKDVNTENEDEDSSGDENYICSYCNNEAKKFCEDCSKLFCKNCFNTKHKIQHQNKIQEIDLIKSQKKKNKKFFLISISGIIKIILKKSNYLIDHEKIIISPLSHNNNNSRINYIKRKFDYPNIKNANDIQSQIDFLQGINQILLDDNCNLEKFDDHSFRISEMNEKLLDIIKKIFKDEKKDLLEMSFNELSNDDSIKSLFKIEGRNLESNEYKIDKNEFIKSKNKFYYVINLIPQSNFKYNRHNIKTVFINKIKDSFNINETNIFLSFNNKNSFVNTFIKTKEFCISSFKEIQKNYPDFNKLYEYKIIYDNILNNKEYEKYFDYQGNTIEPNSSHNLKRGSKYYYPPYGWFGIGLKVMGEHDKGNDEWLNKESNEWAIAYYPLGKSLSSDKVKELLYNIITKKKINNGENQLNCSSIDIRNSKVKNENEIYLTPDINIAEKFSGELLLNQKRYRVVLMAKVKIKNIREPVDLHFWLLNKDFIRFYRILVKRI